MADQGAHPIWACDDEAIKDEYRRVCEDRDKYLSWHQRADSEAERAAWERDTALARLEATVREIRKEHAEKIAIAPGLECTCEWCDPDLAGSPQGEERE